MAHFLTTDWTNKIKTNPVANMILNNNTPKEKYYRIRLRELTHHPKEGQLISYRFIRNFLGPVDRDEIVTEEYLNTALIGSEDGNYVTAKQYKTSYNSAIEALRKHAVEGGDDGIVGAGSGIALDADSDDDVAIVADHGDGKEDEKEDVKEDDEFAGAVDFEDENEDYPDILIANELEPSRDMWKNIFVDDYIHIHHPKVRSDYIYALTGKPLQIKPPSVFFSDV